MRSYFLDFTQTSNFEDDRDTRELYVVAFNVHSLIPLHLKQLSMSRSKYLAQKHSINFRSESILHDRRLSIPY